MPQGAAFQTIRQMSILLRHSLPESDSRRKLHLCWVERQRRRRIVTTRWPNHHRWRFQKPPTKWTRARLELVPSATE